jgi:hypothetical protein
VFPVLLGPSTSFRHHRGRRGRSTSCVFEVRLPRRRSDVGSWGYAEGSRVREAESRGLMRQCASASCGSPDGLNFRGNFRQFARHCSSAVIASTWCDSVIADPSRTTARRPGYRSEHHSGSSAVRAPQ